MSHTLKESNKKKILFNGLYYDGVLDKHLEHNMKLVTIEILDSQLQIKVPSHYVIDHYEKQSPLYG